VKKILVGVLMLTFVVACNNTQHATEMPSPTPIPEPSSVPSPTLAPVEMIADIAYVEDGDYYQKLDVYRPEGSETALPTLVAIHGGGEHRDSLEDLARFFAARGYAVVSIDHRAYPQSVYPDQVEDVFCALAWVHVNADSYDFDVDRVSALGHSSGGTLAAMYGVVDDPIQFLRGCDHQLPESDWVRAIVPFTGIFDYATAAAESDGLRNYAETYLGGDQQQAPDVWAEASAVTWVDGSEPPFLLIHGGDDTNILPTQSEEFAAALEEAGVEVELVIVPGATHGVIMRSEEVFEIVVTFLERVMD
jgi:acetyl esterase/lipase